MGKKKKKLKILPQVRAEGFPSPLEKGKKKSNILEDRIIEKNDSK